MRSVPLEPRWSPDGFLTELEGVVAREAIRDLVTRYNSYGDSGRFGPLEELFTAEATMEIVWPDHTDVHVGRPAIMAMFDGAKSRVGNEIAAERPAFVRHYTATHQIDLADAGTATGRLYFAVILAHGLDHWGRYIDRYVREDGRWRFCARRVHVDGRSDSSWFAK